MCVCVRAWATRLLSGRAAEASAPETDPNNPDHFDMELEACLDAMAALPGAMSTALYQQNNICLLSLSLLPPSFWYIGDPEEAAIPAPEAAAALVGAPLTESFTTSNAHAATFLMAHVFFPTVSLLQMMLPRRTLEPKARTSVGFSGPSVFRIHWKHAHACMHARVRCHLSR